MFWGGDGAVGNGCRKVAMQVGRSGFGERRRERAKSPVLGCKVGNKGRGKAEAQRSDNNHGGMRGCGCGRRPVKLGLARPLKRGREPRLSLTRDSFGAKQRQQQHQEPPQQPKEPAREPSTSLDKLRCSPTALQRCQPETAKSGCQPARAASTILSHLRAETKAGSVGSFFMARCPPETRNKIKQSLCLPRGVRRAIGQQQQRTQLQRGFIHAALPGRLLLLLRCAMCDVRCAACASLTARHPGPKRAPDSANGNEFWLGMTGSAQPPIGQPLRLFIAQYICTRHL